MYSTAPFRTLFNEIMPTAEAHCDTADGPAVVDGRRALETGNVNYALKWIQADDEDQLTEVYTKAMAVRKLGPQAAELATPRFIWLPKPISYSSQSNCRP